MENNLECKDLKKPFLPIKLRNRDTKNMDFCTKNEPITYIYDIQKMGSRNKKIFETFWLNKTKKYQLNQNSV